MSHRELVVGCHSFQSLFSSRMPTDLVFTCEISDGWSLQRIVRDRGTPQAQLLVLCCLVGEVIARDVVTTRLHAQGAGNPEFLIFAHCDIHPLPTWQPRGLPSYVHAEEQLAADFCAEKELLRVDGTAVRSSGPYGYEMPYFSSVNDSCLALLGVQWSRIPLCAMIDVLVECIPSRGMT
mmetsp:Transcript_10664/g.31666  ORF Transcript_10664/g.31666 Transcript_10664/m.31666 type:complete len:179 (-) Transcript_10664:629-1165(-)